MSNASRHPIRYVVQQTGLSAHAIRVWERRYGAVRPLRSGSNRRLYSDAEIERLILLRQAIDAGHSIGHVARLPTRDLRRFSRSRRLSGTERPGYVEQVLDAVQRFDRREIERCLSAASAAMSEFELIDAVVVPVVRSVGELWHSGRIRIAQEHLATAAIQCFLGRFLDAGAVGNPVLVVSTLPGERHEIGALLSAVTASSCGWAVKYLGANLPVAETAGAAIACGARAVALSLVFPESDTRAGADLRQLSSLLPDGTDLWLGGRAAESVVARVPGLPARLFSGLASFRSVLTQ